MRGAEPLIDTPAHSISDQIDLGFAGQVVAAGCSDVQSNVASGLLRRLTDNSLSLTLLLNGLATLPSR